MSAEKILLIDDDADDQLFFTEVINEINPKISCELAGNGIEGMEQLKNGFIPDLIFLDLNMPYMNGFDFLVHFMENKSWKSIPIVIFTTSNQQQDIERSKELGAKAFLTKPNNVRDLFKVLENLLSWDFQTPEMKVF